MLHLSVLGDPQLQDDDGTSLTGVTRQAKRLALLIFLACDRLARPHRRDEVLAMFWPEADEGHGRNSLRQALHAIRSELGHDVIRGSGTGELWVDRALMDCDTDAFVGAIAQGDPEAALRIYRGDFLEGFFASSAPFFGSWADDRRAELRAMAARAARDLAHRAEGMEDASGALFWWRRVLRHRPYDESVIRRIASILAWEDDRAEAMAELEAFRRRVLDELGFGPSSRTAELMARISVGDLRDVARWVGDRRGGEAAGSAPHWRRSGDPF